MIFFILRSPVVESLFLEDVIAWPDASDIRYTPKVEFTGISGFDHLFDFVIPKSTAKQPERIVQAINRPTRDTAEAFIYKWRHSRGEALGFESSNDFEQAISGGVLDAFRNYQINPVPWSHGAEVVVELVA